MKSCPDPALPESARRAVRNAVLGFGPRPRIAYEIGGKRLMAIGRRGESADSLRLDLVRTYGLPTWMVEARQANDALAEYAAHGGNYRPYARRLGVRDETFLAKAMDPAEVEQSALLSDRQVERVWRLQTEYVIPEGDEAADDPGESATTPGEVVVSDPGGEPEAPPPLPMAIPKADGRGKNSRYFGFGLDRGGGQRFNEENFLLPLRIALGGVLNRELGFGGTERVDECVPYAGDGDHWGRNNPLAPRVVDAYRGPVCRTLEHQVWGEWYGWLGSAYAVPDSVRWEVWMRRARVYARQRKKIADREAELLLSDPPSEGGLAKAA